jgi:5-methyltetrahydrofolate--homocysteine methyltransferase
MDGAMGTMLMEKGLKPGGAPEAMLLDAFDKVAQVHSAYVKAGADIVESNTFGANRIKLADYGLSQKTKEINKRGIEAVKASGAKFVAGSIGSTGRFIETVGDLSFDDAVDIFKEQASSMIEAGADLISIETMIDIKEIKAAIIAIREISDIPIMSHMTFEAGGRTTLGTSPEAASVTLSSLGCDLIGINCSLGPEGIIPLLKRMRQVSDKPFVVQPNAGMPIIRDGITMYTETGQAMASFVPEFIELGVRVIGSCCGTTPAHTKIFRKAIDSCDHKMQKFSIDGSFLSSRTSFVHIGQAMPVRVIGERINPTGRKSLAKEIESGNFGIIRDEALSQVESGADILDVNVGVPSIDEVIAMQKAVLSVTSIVDVPVSIDSPNPEAIRAGLKIAPGKSLINSISGEKESIEKLLPLAKLYGAGFIALLMDEHGVPETASKRIKVLEKILERTDDLKIPRTDIYVDCLTMAVSSDVALSRQTLETMRIVKKEFGLNLVLGVSNVSFGLPSRPILNSAFLSMAIDAGLDLAIINPLNKELMDVRSAANVLTGRDHKAQAYIKRFSQDKTEKDFAETTAEPLIEAVIQGNDVAARDIAQRLMDEGKAPLDVSNTLLIPAMEEVGRLFDKGTIFLPQMLSSANAMREAFKVIEKYLKKEDVKTPIKVILATVEGDVHDIGKNIVGVILENNGFEVVDLGKSCVAETVLKTAKKMHVKCIGLSALMTTSLPSMERTVKLLKDSGDFFVMVGGAVLNEEIAKKIGADAYGKDAMDGLRKLKQWLSASQK